MNPTERSSGGCGWSMQAIMRDRACAKSKWLSSLNNNRRRWKVPS